MTGPDIHFEVDHGVARLRLSRPGKRNALTREMLWGIASHLRSIEGLPDLRLLVLSAEGSVFCAGMDLGQMQETAQRDDAFDVWQGDARLYRHVVGMLADLAAPTLAVVGGPAVAGGVGLVAACDLALAAEEATFSLPEPRRGITAAVVTPLLLRRVGMAAAGHLLLSGESWSADDALRWGLCQRVLPAGQLDSAATELARSILSGAPQAVRETKRFLRDCLGGRLDAQLDRATDLSALARSQPEAREGLQAFLEKRTPAWGSGSP